MPSKDKAYDDLEEQSSENMNNPIKSSSQMSNKSNMSSGTRSESRSCSDSEGESNPSISPRSTQHSQAPNSQQSNRSTNSIGSKNGSQSQVSNCDGSDSDASTSSSRSAKHSQESRVTNSWQSNKSTKSACSAESQGKSQNSLDSGSNSDSNSHGNESSQQSKITNSQLSNESKSSVLSKKSVQSNSLKSISDSDSDGSLVTKRQNSSVHKKALSSRKAGYFSDSDDQESTTMSALKSVQPQDDSDSDTIINRRKKKPMSKDSIRNILDDYSSSASDSKTSKIKISVTSDSSDKSSSAGIGKRSKKMKVRRRVIQRVESDSSDEDSTGFESLKNTTPNHDHTGKKPNRIENMQTEELHATSSEDEEALSSAPLSGDEAIISAKRKNRKNQDTKDLPTNSDTNVPSWKKSMGVGLLDDTSSEDERGLDVPSPVSSALSDSETKQLPKQQKKKFQKMDEMVDCKSKMTAKQRRDEAKEAFSFSQRQRRVEHAELPYHVPKQRSLAEFMARRQTLPAATSTSLKMPSWQLKAHWKQMAEQEKEASIFFKSESDQSEDETEKCLNQVSAALSKELEDKSQCPEQSSVTEKSQEITSDVGGNSAVVENKASTSVNEALPNTTCVGSVSDKEEPQDTTSDSATPNVLPPAVEKMDVDPEMGCLESANIDSLPLLSTDSNALNDDHDPSLEIKEKFAEMVDKDDDNSSDSDVALRLSDSEDEKVKERPLSKTVNKEMTHPEEKEPTEQENTMVTETTGKKPGDFEICDMSSDSDNEAASDSKLGVVEKTGDVSDKKLAMLRRRGLIDVANIKPRLSGSKNEIIDLDEDVTAKRSGVMDLMQRFIKHSSKKKPNEEKREVELSIVSAEQGADGLEMVQKELVTILLGEDEEVRDPVPGAKLQRLKKTLQKQMALKRNAEWKRKEEEKKINSEVLGDEETSDCGMLDEETEMTDSEEEDGAAGEDDNEEVDEDADDEEEEEEEENDVLLKEKKRPQSEFLDEEADESVDGDADISNDEDDEEADDANDSDKGEEDKEVEEPLAKVVSEEVNVKSSQSKSRFKRLQTFDMFDSDDDLETSIVEKWAALETEEATTPTSPVIPPGQNAKSPFDSQYAVSPMIFNRRSAPTQESPITSHKDGSTKADDDTCVASTQDYLNEIMKGTTVKPKEPNHTSSLKKFLFKADITNTQMEEDELLSLCSGKFQTQVGKSADDELAELCSGRFPTQTQTQQVNGVGTQETSDDFSQDAQEFGEGTQDKGEEPLSNMSSQNITSSLRKDTVQPWVDLEIVSSDDEEQDQYKDQSKPKKMQKKLNFSDEEDEEDDLRQVLEDDLDVDAGEDAEEDLEDDAAVESAGEVDYDSEENEVRAAGEKARPVAKDFFEAEAELSESEWGSADEDEQDLDKLDYAAADEEQFDQEQMKEQLDKIHMRQILDADKREVRMLQEMLFEDGDLHAEGGGRERKFRWKNLGDDDINAGLRGDSGDEGAGDEDEAEDEEKWRIMRHERETFLREQKEKAEAAGKEDQGILEDEDSQFLKLGKAALKRIRSVHSQEQIAIERNITLRKTVSDALMSPDAKRKCNPVVQRGSFLARGESALARIAAITRGTTGKVVLNAKNSRNFVFTAISPKEEVVEEPVKVTGKRKAPAVTPTLIKKTKVTEDNSKGRRLFDHLT